MGKNVLEQKLKDCLRPTWNKMRAYANRKNCYRKTNQNKLIELKNKYQGQRCFIIGNGPSLKIEDLAKIAGEITFASNRIYVIFDKTLWRPTYYFCQDPIVLKSCINDIRNINDCIKLIRPIGLSIYNDKNAICFNIDCFDYNNKVAPRFSTEANFQVFEGFTVTYSMLQFAVYMGFKEIYLVGVDANYSPQNRVINENSYADKRMYNKSKVSVIPNIEYNLLAYNSAKNYAISNDVRIYNATRGGMLEVFPRINLDEVLGIMEKS